MGSLVGPIFLTPGHALPSLGEQDYIIAEPTDSELDLRQLLLQTSTYESHYIDCEVNDVIDMIRHMLKRHANNKVPFFQVDDVMATITTDISGKDSAYDVLCDVAAMTKTHLFIGDVAIVLSSKPFKEIASNPNDGKEKS